MKEHSSETIIFLPDRLNRHPPVYRGMTFHELVIVMLIGASIGGIIGILIMLLFNIGWYVIFMGMLVFGVISVRFGGFYISRLKRGKPDTWIARYIELKRNPSAFIISEQKQYWSIKRINKKGLF